MKLSIIVPFFNEENNLPELHARILKTIKNNQLDAEIIYVDDGSTDDSSKILQKIIGRKVRPKTKIISLRKNFGQTPATVAGIDNAKGELLTFLDADLQNDPDEIPKLLNALDKETEAVLGWRKDRKDSLFHNFATAIINTLISKILKIPLHDTGCSQKVIRRQILDDIKLYGEFHRLIPIILYWQGYNIKEVVVNHFPRKAGVSKYNYFKIIKFAIDLLTAKFLYSFGTKPAYIFGLLGFFFCLAAFIPLAVTAYEKLFSGIYVHRNPLFLIASFLIVIGIQFILMGLLAELLVRIYFETQHKKIYQTKLTYQ